MLSYIRNINMKNQVHLMRPFIFSVLLCVFFLHNLFDDGIFILKAYVFVCFCLYMFGLGRRQLVM